MEKFFRIYASPAVSYDRTTSIVLDYFFLWSNPKRLKILHTQANSNFINGAPLTQNLPTFQNQV